MMKVHYNLLAGASALALAWAATPAFAADAAPSTAVDTKDEVDTLIVTARRQAENLQDVPETVVPLTSKKLQDLEIHQLQDIDTIVPGLNLTSGNFASVQLRGVAFNAITNGDSTIAFYLNDADVNPGIVLQALYDIGQVEVLKGPQGTNRGVSAPSGAITLTTHRPDLNNFGAYANVTLDDQRGRNFEGGVGGPIIPGVLAVRFAGIYQETDGDDVGSIHNSTRPDDKTLSGRVSVRFTPTDALEANVMYQHLERYTISFPQVFGPGDGTAINPAISPEQRLSVTDGDGESHNFYEIGNATVDYRAFGHKFSYVAGYTYGKATSRAPQDITNALPGIDTYTTTERLGNKELSQEFRVASDPAPGRWLDYTLGVYYRNFEQFGNSHFAGQFLPGAFGSPLAAPNPTGLDGRYFLDVLVQVPFTYHELSFFGNATAHIGSDTDLTVGLRRLDSEFKGHSVLNTSASFAAFSAAALRGAPCSLLGFASTYPGTCDSPVPSMLVSDVSDDDKADKTLYSVELTHRFTRDFMVYANTGTSFLRPTATIGLQGPFASSTDPMLRQLAFHPPQTSTGYEAGFKWTLPDARGHVDVAVYKQDFDNFQIVAGANFLNTAVTPASRSSFGFPTGVTADIKGIDLDAAYNIMPGWTADLLASYAGGQATGSVPCNLFDGSGNPIYNTAGIISFCPGVGKVSTQPLWNASLQSSYTRTLANGMEGFVRGLLTYYPDNDRASLVYTVPAYALLNLFAGVQSADRAWELSAYVKNAFNDHTLLGRSDQPLFPAGLGQFPTLNVASHYFSAALTPSREIGVTVKYAWGSR